MNKQMNGIWDKMIGLCLSTLVSVRESVTVHKVNLKNKASRELLFRKLIAVYYGVTSLIASLGYTPQDVHDGVKTYMAENNIHYKKA